VSVPDLILVRRAKEGDLDAMGELVVRYRRYACSIGNRFYFAGGDHDDVDQEALIAIMVAVRSFRESADRPFKPFLGLCVQRWLMTALKTSKREKHRALDEAQRNVIDEDGDLSAAAERVPDRKADPCEIAIRREQIRELIARLETLSELERAAVIGIANGESYEEIGERFKERYDGGKTIDNAVQRGRKKLAA